MGWGTGILGEHGVEGGKGSREDSIEEMVGVRDRCMPYREGRGGHISGRGGRRGCGWSSMMIGF